MRKYYVLAVTLLLAATLAGEFLSSAQSAATTTFTVNSLGDTPDASLADGLCADASGACTLRASIQQANSDLLDETISFSVTGTINLTTALPELSTNITINGPGPNELNVRRDTAEWYRIFKISVGATVSISGLTISNGIAPREFTNASGGGGGISNSGVLTLTNCIITGNSTIQPQDGGALFTGSGGGIDNTGTLTMTACTVSNNTAGRGGISKSGGGTPGGDGGGVNNIGALTMTNCTISGNSAGDGSDGGTNGGPGGRGGGISNSNTGGPHGTMSLTSCTVSQNRSGRGGVATVAGPGGPGGYGGGIYNLTAMTITGSTVNNNVTGDGRGGFGGAGGGIYNFRTLIVSNTTVSGNSTGRGGFGGGANNPGDGGDGGGIGNSGNLKLSNSTVVLNATGQGGSGRDGRGGGVHGAAQIRSNIIADNVTSATTGRDVFGNYTSSGYNLIGLGEGGSGFLSTDQVGSSSQSLPPGIGPLGLYGGPTRTHILLIGSAAIDTGLARDIDDNQVTADQRGFARPFDVPNILPAAGGDNGDVGAFERQSSEPTPEPTPQPTPTPTPTPPPTPTPTPTPPPTIVLFDFGPYSVTEACTIVVVRISRLGPKEGTTEVTYEARDGGAKQPADFISPSRRVAFGPNEDTKTVLVLISDDSRPEGTEEFELALTSVKGGTIGFRRVITVTIGDNDPFDRPSSNPIDNPATFVCQHYHDFLNRQPDNEGLNFWTNQITACGTDPGCLAEKRENVSAAFVLSIEFQQTGFFVSRAYQVGLGALPDNPRYAAFLNDAYEIGRDVVVGQPGFLQLLEANQESFSIDFVERPEFRDTIGKLDRDQYVEALFANAGVTPTVEERRAALDAFGGGITAERARTLRSVIESGSVYNKLYNQAFVQLQYFGYLRRNADDLPDRDFGGYNFWLTKLNSFTFPGEDVRDEGVALTRVKRAEMVRAFITSGEYRGRFVGDPNQGQ